MQVGTHVELQKLLKFSSEEWRRYPPPPDFSTEGLESFAEFGTPIVGRYLEKGQLTDLQNWIAGVQQQAQPRAVFMDTTTIAAVESLLCDNSV
jgi:hypothetical protein